MGSPGSRPAEGADLTPQGSSRSGSGQGHSKLAAVKLCSTTGDRQGVLANSQAPERQEPADSEETGKQSIRIALATGLSPRQTARR